MAWNKRIPTPDATLYGLHSRYYSLVKKMVDAVLRRDNLAKPLASSVGEV